MHTCSLILIGCHQPPSLGRSAFSCCPVKSIGQAMLKRGSPPGGSGPATKNIKEGLELPWASKTYQQAKLLSYNKGVSRCFQMFPTNLFLTPILISDYIWSTAPPRLFDVDGGQHPVQMLLDDLVPSMYEPIQTWLEEILPATPHPQNFVYPAPQHRLWALGVT